MEWAAPIAFSSTSTLDFNSSRLRSHQVWRAAPFASRRVDGAEAGGVVDELQEIGILRQHRIVDKKLRDDLPDGRIESMPGVGAADSPPPCDHLPSVRIVTHQFDNALHVLLKNFGNSSAFHCHFYFRKQTLLWIFMKPIQITYIDLSCLIAWQCAFAFRKCRTSIKQAIVNITPTLFHILATVRTFHFA